MEQGKALGFSLNVRLADSEFGYYQVPAKDSAKPSIVFLLWFSAHSSGLDDENTIPYGFKKCNPTVSHKPKNTTP